VTSHRVPHEPASVGFARASLVSDLNRLGTVAPEIRDHAALVVSELLGNAIRHAAPLDDGQVLVSWGVQGGALEISVTDGSGPTIPRHAHAPVLATGGRGFTIIEALVERWWRDADGPVSTVYARLPLWPHATPG
jgi:anti-sigma regulatory factor (Ser/Thr protein kinase)